MKLTHRQLEVLGDLNAAVRVNPVERITVMLCGGRDGSYHSSVLAQLCRKGLVTRKKVGMYGKCSW